MYSASFTLCRVDTPDLSVKILEVKVMNSCTDPRWKKLNELKSKAA
jgi:hypothetical protein